MPMITIAIRVKHDAIDLRLRWVDVAAFRRSSIRVGSAVRSMHFTEAETGAPSSAVSFPPTSSIEKLEMETKQNPPADLLTTSPL